MDGSTHALVDAAGTPQPLDLPLNQAFMEKLSLTNRFDPSATADNAVSFT